MPHVREQITTAIKTVCTGLTTTGANVFVSRVYTFNDAVLPCINIYGTDEEVDETHVTIGKQIVRNLDVMVEARAKVYSEATDPVDNVLNDICAEVETAISADHTLGGLCVFCIIAGTHLTLEAEHEKPVGLASMRFRAQYATLTTDPTTPR